MTAISQRIRTRMRIGVGWSVQEIDAAPRESTDMTLDAVLTEQEFILCGDRL
jgi:5-formyltetrahydrofolate cyclo-ligase